MADQTFNVNCGFFDAINKDRLYTADQMNRPYKRLVSNGVFATPAGTPSTDLQVVSAASGMNIICKAGEGIFADKWFENPADLIITVPANTNITPRRDSVIIQVDKRSNGRVGNIVYRTGTPSSNPQPPAIGTVTNVIEYRLANIYVAAGANYIGNDAIVDLRGSSECPWVTHLLKQVDTSTLYNQWREAYQAYYDQETEAFNEFMRQLTEQLSVNTNLAKYESHYVTTVDGETQIPINLVSYNKSKDVLIVRINHLFASEGTDYTIANDSSSITLTKDLKANQNVDFLVLQSVVVGDTATVLQLLQTINNTLSGITTDSGWINFTLENSVQAYSAALTPAYRKYNKDVHLRGCVKNVTANNTVLATLPEGYRPAMTRYYTISTGSITVTIEIGTNGQLKVANVIGTLTAASLIPIDTNFIIG